MNFVSGWQNFYVIVGSAGGALIGIQFVVIALIANTRKHTDAQTINAFGTPTVVHFGGALTISAIMTAPWPSLVALRVALALGGLGGLAYAAVVFRRAGRQTGYKPVAEDWIWYVIIPTGVYALLAAAAFLLLTFTQAALFAVGGAALGLLLIGVRNAWDTVTHLVSSGPASGETKPV
jgi:hypothetical protein